MSKASIGRKLVKGGLVGLGGLVVILAGMAAVGAFMPKAHQAQGTVVVRAPPSTVWSKLAELKDWAKWNRVVEAVEPVNAQGREVYRVKDMNGEMPLEIVEKSPPGRIVTRIADPDLPFGGTWTWQLEPASTGTRITVVEQGEVRNPLFRFMAKYVFGHNRTIDAYLKEIAREFGEAGTAT